MRWLVLLVLMLPACGQSVAVQQWQVQMTTRINAIVECMSVEQRACIDEQEAIHAGPY